MEKNRILYVGGFQLPDKNAAAHRVLGIAKILRELGYEVVFLDVSDDYREEGVSGRHMVCGFDTWSQKHCRGVSEWLSYASKPLNVETLLNRYDGWSAVIAYNYPALALNGLLRLCRKRGIRLISDCTEWYAFGGFRPHALLTFVDSELRMRVVQKKLDGMIAISRYLERYYRRYFPVTVIPPLVDLSDSKWRAAVKEKREGVRIVYAGSPGKRKDRLNGVLRAAAESGAEVRIDLIGLSREQYLSLYPKDRELTETLCRDGRLRFYGRLSHTDTLNLVRQADYTAFYRKRSVNSRAGFPTKFVESVTCGVPVITTDTSDLREYSGNGRNCVFLDFAHFEEELTAFLRSSSVSDRKEAEKETFCCERFVPEMSDFLERLVNHG